MGVNHLAFTYVFFRPPKGYGSTLVPPKPMGGVRCSTGHPDTSHGFCLCYRIPKQGLDCVSLLVMAPAHIWLWWSHEMWCYHHDSTTTIHVSWKYKIQFCCHTNLFGEWPFWKNCQHSFRVRFSNRVPNRGPLWPPPSHQFAEHTSPGEDAQLGSTGTSLTWPSEVPQLNGTHLSKNANTRSTSSTALPAAPNKN